jgi:hypothetical protein
VPVVRHGRLRREQHAGCDETGECLAEHSVLAYLPVTGAGLRPFGSGLGGNDREAVLNVN